MLNEQAKQLNQQRIDEGNRAKAESFAAQKAAVAARAWWRFCLRHSGQSGLKHGDYFSCQANDDLLTNWIDQQEDPIVDERSLENAFAACRPMLAIRPGLNRPYERKTNLQESRHMPQIKGLNPAPPPLVLPYTRSEILSWSPSRLQQEMKKSPRHVDALNRILSGHN